MMNILLTLILLSLSQLSASKPMEPARRNLFVYQHGIGSIDKGHVHRECDAVSGSGGGTFNSKGNTGHLVGEVTNSFHHVYNQSLSYPGWTPVHLKWEFGDRSYTHTQALEYTGQIGSCDSLRVS